MSNKKKLKNCGGILRLRLCLVRVKVFPENRYFPKMLFSGKENILMCLVAFQKIFRKIFSDVWLYSWKYHRKHIFYLLLSHFLTFFRLPNGYIISFIHQNTNKTQKKIIKSGQTKVRSWSVRSWSRSARSQSARSQSERSRSTPIGAVSGSFSLFLLLRLFAECVLLCFGCVFLSFARATKIVWR